MSAFTSMTPQNLYSAAAYGFAEGAVASSLFAAYYGGFSYMNASAIGFNTGIATALASCTAFQVGKFMGWKTNFDGMNVKQAVDSVSWTQCIVGSGLALGAGYVGYNYAAEKIAQPPISSIHQQASENLASPVRVVQQGNRVIAYVPRP